MAAIFGAWLRRKVSHPWEGDPERLKRSRRGGMAAASQTARFVSSLSNWAVKGDYLKLSGNPVQSTRMVDKKQKDLSVLGPEDLPVWWEALQKIPREHHREAHLFAMLSGLRRESLVGLQWRNLDLKRRCIRVEGAKGDKDFDLILSGPMLRCLWRARRVGRRLFNEQSRKGVFPSALGHMRGDALSKDDLPAYNHGLRRTYATLARDAGIPKDMIAVLLNHGENDVTSRYIRDSRLGRLYGAGQQDISAHMIKLLGSPRGLA